MAGRRRALIVANGEYDNAGLQRLGSPAADADALAGVLADRTISDFDVRVVRNETAHVVQAEIEDLCAEGRPDDVLLLHFSCHGLKDDSGGLYFAARNTRPDRLRSTAVPAHFVQQCIRQSRSRSIVLLLDCCYGGAFGQGVAVRASGDANVLDSFRGGRGRAVITASNSIEYAFEGARLASDEPARPSVFTSALVEGLRTGEADRDEDGWIALGELYEYLFDRVRERNPKQTPSRDIEMQGELYLAKSRRRRIKPSPIPPDLAAAITAENPFTRLGAVAELRRRLSSDNLPVAMGAFEALKVMASTDIEHIAAAAADALGDVVVRVDVPEVRLSAPAGSSASASLRALGPPVAREVRFEASHPWIAVVESAGRAELTVTAGETGTRRGKVVVSGPTGDVVVGVEIEAIPVPAPDPAPAPAPEPDSAPAPDPAPAPDSATAPAPSLAPAPEPSPASEPVATEPDSAPAREPAPQPAPEPAKRATLGRTPGPETEPVDPAGGFGGITAITGAVLAVIGLGLDYRYGESLTYYRPGMETYVGIVAACALLSGILTLAPRTRTRTGPALLLGTGLAALFGLLRFLGDVITLNQEGDADLGAGFTFLLLAHIAWAAAQVCAPVVLRRNPGGTRTRGWPAWAAAGLGIVLAAAWLTQLAELAQHSDSEAGRAAAYFVLGALLALLVPVVAVTLPGAGWAVLATGTAGLAGVLAPTFVAVAEHSTVAGQVIASGAVLLLAVDVVVLARRNQPIEGQS
ncbi:caspase family protein [Amycolatopsis lexingtonensis]|uniref:caspase family protein n=1 Tax=Amycolatopsis lexingtonensis TaxID=218822 RepID=UPI003F71E87E